MAVKVLLVEDEPNIAEAIRFLLQRDGCEVEVIADGAAALDRVAAAPPDLVILDLMLPGRSGLEILTALRAAPATAALPVLMLTAKGQGRDREAAERAGVSRFMTKPFSNADIREAVRSLVSGAGTGPGEGSGTASGPGPAFGTGPSSESGSASGFSPGSPPGSNSGSASGSSPGSAPRSEADSGSAG